MLSEKYRRLWRRRLRRRPLLPFLLVATLAVDLVLLQNPSESPYVTGVIGGQISLLGVWVTWAPRHLVTRACIALGAVLLGLAASDNLAFDGANHPEFPIGDVMISIDLRSIMTTVVLASLATTVTATAIVQCCGRWGRSSLGAPLRPRIGIGFLFSLMTLIAVAISYGRQTDWDVLTLTMVAVLIFCEGFVVAVVLALSLAISNFGWRLLLLLAAPSAAIVAHAAVTKGPELDLASYFATHVAFLGGWLVAVDSRPHRLQQADKQASPAAMDLQA